MTYLNLEFPTNKVMIPTITNLFIHDHNDTIITSTRTPIPDVSTCSFSYQNPRTAVLTFPSSTRSDDGRTTTPDPCHHLPDATRFHLPYHTQPQRQSFLLSVFLSVRTRPPFTQFNLMYAHPVSRFLYHHHHLRINVESLHHRAATSSAGQRWATRTTSSDPRTRSSFSAASAAKIARRPRTKQRRTCQPRSNAKLISLRPSASSGRAWPLRSGSARGNETKPEGC
jgi:hypothetical protein